MKKIISYAVEPGTTMLVEVDAPDDTGIDYAGPVADQTTQTFEEALQSLQPAIEKVRQTLDDLNHPQTIELSFGIKIAGGVGAVFASASTEANFSVTLTWTNPPHAVIPTAPDK